MGGESTSWISTADNPASSRLSRRAIVRPLSFGWIEQLVFDRNTPIETVFVIPLIDSPANTDRAPRCGGMIMERMNSFRFRGIILPKNHSATPRPQQHPICASRNAVPPSANIPGGSWVSPRLASKYSNAAQPAHTAATGASRTVALRPGSVRNARGARLGPVRGTSRSIVRYLLTVRERRTSTRTRDQHESHASVIGVGPEQQTGLDEVDSFVNHATEACSSYCHPLPGCKPNASWITPPCQGPIGISFRVMPATLRVPMKSETDSDLIRTGFRPSVRAQCSR